MAPELDAGITPDAGALAAAELTTVAAMAPPTAIPPMARRTPACSSKKLASLARTVRATASDARREVRTSREIFWARLLSFMGLEAAYEIALRLTTPYGPVSCGAELLPLITPTASALGR
jgi:hypothetical protein